MGLWLNICSIGQAARGPGRGSAKIFKSKRGPQPKKFGNRCPRVQTVLLHVCALPDGGQIAW